MIPCGACGHENDPTRVFCQNCGVRLDKSAVTESPDGAASPAPAGAPPPSPVQFRAGRDTPKPPAMRSGALFKGVWIFLKEVAVTAALAFVIACLVQMLRAPDGVVAAKAPLEASASLLAADIQAARDNPYPRALTITADQANNFLAARLAPALAGPMGWPPVSFSRAFVVPADGRLTLAVQQAFMGLPVFLQVTVEPVAGDGGIGARLVGGRIGRLPLPTALLPQFEKSFSPTLGALATPMEWFRSASSVEISPAGAVVNWPGKTR